MKQRFVLQLYSKRTEAWIDHPSTKSQLAGKLMDDAAIVDKLIAGEIVEARDDRGLSFHFRFAIEDAPDAQRPQLCRSCRQPISWLKTSNDKLIPVDAETVRSSDTHFDGRRHVSHFATCPQAKKWRKPKQKKQ